MAAQKHEQDNLKSRKLVADFYKDRKILIVFILILLAVLFIIVFVALDRERQHRTESYKEVTGVAGLNATIEYDCKDSCYDFNVYIFDADGRQISVVQPNQDGQVRLALPEGDYVMLIGKMLGDAELFPQESLVLKNGQELDLKLSY